MINKVCFVSILFLAQYAFSAALISRLNHSAKNIARGGSGAIGQNYSLAVLENPANSAWMGKDSMAIYQNHTSLTKIYPQLYYNTWLFQNGFTASLPLSNTQAGFGYVFSGIRDEVIYDTTVTGPYLFVHRASIENIPPGQTGEIEWTQLHTINTSVGLSDQLFLGFNYNYGQTPLVHIHALDLGLIYAYTGGNILQWSTQIGVNMDNAFYYESAIDNNPAAYPRGELLQEITFGFGYSMELFPFFAGDAQIMLTNDGGIDRAEFFSFSENNGAGGSIKLFSLISLAAGIYRYLPDSEYSQHMGAGIETSIFEIRNMIQYFRAHGFRLKSPDFSRNQGQINFTFSYYFAKISDKSAEQWKDGQVTHDIQLGIEKPF